MQKGLINGRLRGQDKQMEPYGVEEQQQQDSAQDHVGDQHKRQHYPLANMGARQRKQLKNWRELGRPNQCILCHLRQAGNADNMTKIGCIDCEHYAAAAWFCTLRQQHKRSSDYCTEIKLCPECLGTTTDNKCDAQCGKVIENGS